MVDTCEGRAHGLEYKWFLIELVDCAGAYRQGC